MQVESADISLLGAREENQDKVAVAVAAQCALLLVADGMGGHAEGARAAAIAQKVVLDAFWQTPHPLFDPLGFLHLTLGRAHEEIVRIGLNLPLEQRPRATCALCIVQQHSAWWAHVGDSRIYHLRRGNMVRRTRDHSHVELLLREGLINAEQAVTHPMRNFVESCLGGDPILPDMTLEPRQALEKGDVVFVCTDGMWGTLRDEEIAGALALTPGGLKSTLFELGRRAITRGGPGSDNTSAAVLRYLAD